MADPYVAGNPLQKVHQRYSHDKCQGYFVVSTDESSFRPQDHIHSAAYYREKTPLDPVISKRDNYCPDEQLNMFSLLDELEHHKCHQHDLHDLVPLVVYFVGINGKDRGNIHP